jgi:hypothetical protein
MLIARRACVLALGVIAAMTLASCDSYPVVTNRALPGQPRALAVADFDGNGAADVMVGYGGDYWGVDIEKSDPYGFWSFDHVTGVIPRSDLLAATDFESDGVPDVVAGGVGTNSLDTLHNHGDATFAISSMTVAPSADIKSLESARGSDGVDVVIAGYLDGGTPHLASWVSGSGQLVSRSEPSWSGGLTSATALALGDSDGDGHLDLFVGTSDGTIRMYAGTGGVGALFSASYTELPQYAGAGAVSAIGFGDVTTPAAALDERPDLIAGFDGSAHVAEWQGTVGGFAAPVKIGEYEDSNLRTRSVSLLGTQWTALSNGTDALFGSQGYDSPSPVVSDSEACSDGPASVEYFPSMQPAHSPPGQESDVMDRESIALACYGDDPAAASVGKVNRLLVAFTGIGRLKRPAPIDFDPQAVGSSFSTTATADAYDFVQAPSGPNYRPVVIDGWQITGPDADQFSVAQWASGVMNGCPDGSEDEPYDSCKATVTFAPTSPGAKHATLVIKNNGLRLPSAPMHSVPLSGTAVAPELTVDEALDIGDIVSGESRGANLKITNDGSATFNFDEFDISPAVDGWSVASGSCGASLAVDMSCNLLVTYAPTATGRSSATLSIDGNQFGGPTLVDLDARGVLGALTAAPLAFGDVRVEADGVRTVAFTNEDDGPVQVGSASFVGADAARFSVESNLCSSTTLPVDAACSIKVKVRPTIRGPLAATLRLASDATTSPAEAPLSANGILGIAAADPATFAPLRAGYFAEKTVSIENLGDDDLRLGALRTEGPFSVTAACSSVTVEPGESCPVTVRFSPETAGANPGRLIVPNNGSAPLFAVALSGEGLETESPIPDLEPSRPPSIKLRRLKPSAKRHSMFAAFVVSGGTKGLEGGKLTIDLPADLRWYRMGKQRRIFDRLPRKVNLVIPRVAAGRSRGVAVRLVGSDFLGRSYRLSAKLGSSAGEVDSIKFTVGV